MANLRANATARISALGSRDTSRPWCAVGTERPAAGFPANRNSRRKLKRKTGGPVPPQDQRDGQGYQRRGHAVQLSPSARRGLSG